MKNPNSPSGFCRVGAFYCPYRNGLTTCPSSDFCKDCKYSYTNKEWEEYENKK